MKIDVSVIIANWNTTIWTKNAVRSVMHQEEVKPEVIVVDNGSTDGIFRYIRTMCKNYPERFRAICYGRNYGPARAWNDGMQLSRGKYVCILNSDATMEKTCLKKMLATLKSDRMIGITGPMSNNIASVQGTPKPIDRENFEIKGGKVMPFVCVMIPRPILQEVGLMAERFVMGGAEDKEFCRRVHGVGYKTMVTGNAFCWHALSQAYKANKVNVNEANRKMLALLKEKENIRRLA